MRKQAHMIAVEDSIAIWPHEITALCGETVSEPRPVMTIDVVESLVQAAKTLHLCRICWLLATSSMPKSRRIYAVMPAQEAYEANMNSDL